MKLLHVYFEAGKVVTFTATRLCVWGGGLFPEHYLRFESEFPRCETPVSCLLLQHECLDSSMRCDTNKQWSHESGDSARGGGGGSSGERAAATAAFVQPSAFRHLRMFVAENCETLCVKGTGKTSPPQEKVQQLIGGHVLWWRAVAFTSGLLCRLTLARRASAQSPKPDNIRIQMYPQVVLSQSIACLRTHCHGISFSQWKCFSPIRPPVGFKWMKTMA